MPENILVAVAWPYANADIHVGNIVGAYLPADIVSEIVKLHYRWSDEVDMKAQPWTM